VGRLNSDDKKELLELSRKSISQRITDMEAGYYGGGYGESTKLKYLIQRLTKLDFLLIRRGIDSLDEVSDLLGKKWEEYYDYTNPKDYKKNGYNKPYFVDLYGKLLYKFLLKEWESDEHIHKYSKKTIKHKDSVFRSNWRKTFHDVIKYSDGTERTGFLQRKCIICADWIDVNKPKGKTSTSTTYKGGGHYE